MTRCRGKMLTMKLSKIWIFSLSAMIVIVRGSSGTDVQLQGSVHSSLRHSSNRNMIVDREKVTLIEEKRYKLEKETITTDSSNRMYRTEHMLSTAVPSNVPSNPLSNSTAPTNTPTSTPTSTPSNVPSNVPSSAPSDMPSDMPSDKPSDKPSKAPTVTPTISLSKEENIESIINSTAGHEADIDTAKTKSAEDIFYNETHDEIGSVPIDNQRDVGRSRSYAVTLEEEWYLSDSEMSEGQPYEYRTSTGKSDKTSKTSKSTAKTNKR